MGDARQKKEATFETVMSVVRVSPDEDGTRTVRLMGQSGLASCVALEMRVQGQAPVLFADSMQSGDGFDVHIRMRGFGGDQFARQARATAMAATESRRCTAMLAARCPNWALDERGLCSDCIREQTRATAFDVTAAQERDDAHLSANARAWRGEATGEDGWKRGPGFQVGAHGDPERLVLAFDVGPGVYAVSGKKLDVFELAAILRKQHERIEALQQIAAEAKQGAEQAEVAATEFGRALDTVRHMMATDSEYPATVEALGQVVEAMKSFREGSEELTKTLAKAGML